MSYRFNRDMERNEGLKYVLLYFGIIVFMGIIGIAIRITNLNETTNEATQENKVEIEKSDESDFDQFTTETNISRLILIDTYYNEHVGWIYTFYDSDNFVMYAYMGQEGGITRLDNPDGSPKIYTPQSTK